MARPKRKATMEPKGRENPKESETAMEQDEPNLGTLVNRKRKVAKVPPMPQQGAPENNRKERNPDDEGPVNAKKSRETVRKRTSKGKKVVKRKRKLAEKKEPQKPHYSLSVPELPNLGATEVLVVGTGDVGQLGLGSDVLEKSRPVPITSIPEHIVDIAAGGMHSVCLTSGGRVYTFGCNDDGTLGRVTEEEEEGFEPSPVELPERIVRISAGDTHSAALTETGRVYLWGNFRDSTGLMGLTPNGEKRTLPIEIQPDVPCASLASGAEHLVCLGLDGQLYTLGCSEQGQLGRISKYANTRGGRRGLGHVLKPEIVHFQRSKSHNHYPPEFDQVWAGAYCTYARERHSGTIYGFGLNNYFQLSEDSGEDSTPSLLFMPTPLRILEGSRWRMISGGNHHTLSLDTAGQVHSWGRKDDGRLGLGEVDVDQARPVAVPSLKDVKCSHVACGSTTSYAVSEDGQLFTWGFGENQQLGHGNDEDSNVPKLVESKSMKSRTTLKVDGGGQHTLILATKPDQTS